MTKNLLFLIAGLIAFCFSNCSSENKQIKNAKYYGFTNPTENEGAAYIDIDINQINNLFNQLKRGKSYVAKGAPQYLSLETGNEIDITLQIFPGDYKVMRVIKGKRVTDLWYEFKDAQSLSAWQTLLNSWKINLQKKQK
jgi:transposase